MLKNICGQKFSTEKDSVKSNWAINTSWSWFLCWTIIFGWNQRGDGTSTLVSWPINTLKNLLVDLSQINRPLSLCDSRHQHLCCLVDNLLGKMTTSYGITWLIKYCLKLKLLCKLSVPFGDSPSRDKNKKITFYLQSDQSVLLLFVLWMLRIILLLVDIVIGAFWQQAALSAEVTGSVNYTCLWQWNDGSFSKVCFSGCYLNWTVCFSKTPRGHLKAIKWDFCLITIVFFH